MRVGLGPSEARESAARSAFVVPFSCLSSFSIFRSRSLPRGPVPALGYGARRFSSWSSRVINYG